MSECRISIVIPVYNVSEYVGFCIDSILEQTMTDYEIILVNDGSTDNSLEIIKDYEKRFPDKITVYSIENHGVSYARNYGVERAKGEYVLFVDSDDFLEPDMCEKLITCALENDNDVVLCNYYSAFYNKKKEKFIKKPSSSYIVEICNNFDISKERYELAHISPFPWDKLYRRTLLEKYHFPLGIRFEDLAVVYRIMCEAKSIGVIHENLYNYRKTSSGSFLSSFTEGTLDIEKALRTMVEGFKSDGRFDMYKDEIEYICTRHIFLRYNSFFSEANRGKLDLKLRMIELTQSFLDEYFDNWRNNHYLKYSTSQFTRKRLGTYTDKQTLIKKVKRYERTPMVFIKFKRLLGKCRNKFKAVKGRIIKGVKAFSKSRNKFSYIAKRIPAIKALKMPNDVIYTKYYEKLPVSDNVVLYESKHGDDVAGNIFRMLLSMKKECYRSFDVKLVLKSELIDKYEEMFKKYGIDFVDIVNIEDKQYLKLLATARYLVTDTSFPTYYIKRPEQVYLNTWHGTPLKAMGRIVPNREYGLGNVQRNFYIADYLLYQNEFSRDVFLNDYMITELYNGKVMLSGYPRNSAFFLTDRYDKIRSELDITGMQVIVYMPTWRGLLTKKENNKQIEELENYFYELDESLKDNQIMYVKLHPFVKKAMDLSAFTHIKPAPDGYETYDFLNAADVLVTDYSSIMFDFAVSKKKIILFTYDREEYLRDRGMYLDLNSLEFPIADTVKELVAELNKNTDTTEYPEFFKEYCSYDSGETSDEVCKALFLNEKPCFDISPVKKNGKKNVLVFASFKSSASVQKLTEALNAAADDENCNYYVCMIAADARRRTSLLGELDKRIAFIPLIYNVNYMLSERIRTGFALKTGIMGKKAKAAFEAIGSRELKKHFGNIEFDYIFNYSLNEWVSSYMCNAAKAVTIYNARGINADKMEKSKKYKKKKKFFAENAANYDWIVLGENTKDAVKVSDNTKTVMSADEVIDFKQLMKQIIGK